MTHIDVVAWLLLSVLIGFAGAALFGGRVIGEELAKALVRRALRRRQRGEDVAP